MTIFERILYIWYKPRIKRLHAFLQSNCSRERYEHILRVTATCVNLAPRFGVNRIRAEVIGLAHDMVREWRDEKYLALVEQVGYIPTPFEAEKPMLLHGRCAAILMERNFSVHNESMLRALEDHTLGRPAMDNTGILLFVSDYLEPGRNYTTAEFRDETMQLSPWEMVIAVNEHAMARGKKVSHQTRLMHDYALTMVQGQSVVPGSVEQGVLGA